MLDIIIAGAGIAGLSAGISLRRAGHRVCIYERSGLNDEIGAAIHVPPNASRPLLGCFGLDPAAARFVTVRSISFNEGRTGGNLATVPMGGRIGAQYGAPFFFAHRVDLHEALKGLATAEEGLGVPVEIFTGCQVIGYDPEAPSITLASSEVIRGDVVIAADGIQSVAVEAILGQPNPPQTQEHYNGCYRFLIPAAELGADPETAPWNEDCDGRFRLYADHEARMRLVTYPCRHNEIHNFVGIFYDEGMKSARREDWQTSVDKSQLLKRFSNFHPELLGVINKATEVKQWPLLFRAPVPTWKKGRMVLAGDAAHPMLPHQGQGGAQGLEDGVALGIVLCGAKTPQDIEARLEVYEAARRNRASAMQILSNAGQDEAEVVRREAARYIREPPTTPAEFEAYNFGHDVVAETVRQMKLLVDPAFELPEEFFQDASYYYGKPELLPLPVTDSSSAGCHQGKGEGSQEEETQSEISAKKKKKDCQGGDVILDLEGFSGRDQAEGEEKKTWMCRLRRFWGVFLGWMHLRRAS